jgi:uncharacterized repeat protein (TIGR01451 family)/fimbrial isopeptide formation D2 family protein
VALSKTWQWLSLFVLLLVVCLTKPAYASLNMTATATPSTATLGVGTTIAYTLSGINTSSFASTVTFTDVLPYYTAYNAGTTVVRVNGGIVSTANPTQAAGPPVTLTWANGGAGWNVPSGQTYQITFTATLTAPVQGNFASTITVTDIDGVAPDNDPATAFETALVTVGSPPALLIGKTVSPTTIATGGTATYTMTLQNTGGSSTSGLVIVDTLPTGFTFNSGSTTWNGVPLGVPGNPVIAGQTLTWSVPATTGLTELPAASSRTLTFSVTAPGVNGTFDNKATTRATNVLTGSTGDTATLQVGSGAQMFVCKSIGAAGTTPACSQPAPTTTYTATPGATYRYCITVYNTGTTPITITKIEDYRANGTLFNVGSAQSSLNGAGFAAFQNPTVVNNTMTWQGGPAFPMVLAAGQNFRIRWDHVAPGIKSGIFNNAVCVYNTNTSTNCTGPTAPLVVRGPDYSITKTVITPSPATMVTGGTITYQITVSNNGPSTGTATITDTWTNGWTWVNNSTSESTNGAAFDTSPYFGEGTSPTANSRRWTNVSVPAGGNVRIQFRVNVTNAWAAANPGVYPNNAQVTDQTFTGNDVVLTGDTAPVTIGGAPQISIDKTVSPATVLSFQTVQYTIHVRNASTAPVAGILNGISDTLPTGFTYQPGTSQISSDGTTFAAFQNPVGTTGTITWSGAPGFTINLPGTPTGSDRWLRFTVQVSGTPGTYTNNASALGQNFVDVPTGPIAPVQVSNGPVVTVGKGAATPINTASVPGATASVPAGGGQVCYTITATNTGSVAANNVSFTDILPTGFSYISLSSDLSTNGGAFTFTGDPDATTGTITWAGPFTIPAGGNLRLRFNVNTTATAGSYNNTATASGSNMTTQSSGPTATVTVGTPPNVSISQTPTSSLTSQSGGPGSTTTYTYQMTNAAGTATATGVTFTAILPQYMSVVPGTVLVSVNGGAFTAFSNPGNLTGTAAWSGFANIPAGQNIRIRFNVTMDAQATNGDYVVEAQTQGSNYALATLGNATQLDAYDGNQAAAPMPVYRVTGAAAVQLLAFAGEAKADGVLLTWQTGTEWQNLGYNLYRREGATDEAAKINAEMIGGLGNSSTGGHFRYTDTGTQPGHTYTYWLEDVEFGGPLTRHGPLTLTVPTDDGIVRAAWSSPPLHLPVPSETASGEPPAAATTANPQALGQYLTVLRADDTGMDLELTTPQLTVQRLNQGTVVVLPGLPVTRDVGLPQLPEATWPLSVPRDVPYHLEILEKSRPLVLEDLQLAVAPPAQGSVAEDHPSGTIRRPEPLPSAVVTPVALPVTTSKPADDCHCPQHAPTPATPPGKAATSVTGGSHLQFAFGTMAAVGADYPAEMAAITAAADLRHERLLQLKLYPVQYELDRQRLTQYRTLKVRLTFDGRTRLAPAAGNGPWERAMAVLGRQYGLTHRWVSAPAPVVDDFPGVGTPTWRVTVTTAGLQRVSAAALTAAGVTITEPGRLRLRFRGADVPVERQMQDGELQALVFHAPAAGSAYSDASHYLLTLSETGSPAFAGRRVTPTEAPPLTGAVQSRLHLEEDHLYWANKPVDAFADHWYWDYGTPEHAPAPVTFHLPALPADPNVSSKLQVGLRGMVSDPAVKTNNHVALRLNGQPIGDLRWAGQSYLQTTLAFANTLLQTGQNTLTVTMVNDTGARTPAVYVDSFDLQYWRSPKATAGELAARFSRQGEGTWAVTSLGATAAAYDLTDPQQPVRLEGGEFAAGTWRLTDPDPAFAHDYWFGDPTRMAVPAIAAQTWRDDLHGASAGADYLVIAPAALRSAADRLALHRGAQGLQTRVVPLEAIYDEFGAGQPDPEAIRRFLRWSLVNWPDPKPAYVVLLGDGHYDYRNHYGTSRPVVMPPLLRDHPEIGAVPDENGLAAVLGDDDLPDVMLGRLPAGDSSEADAIVDKLIAYDTAPAGDWMRQGLLVADTVDPAFAAFTATIGETFTGLAWQPFTVLEGPLLRQALGDGKGLSLYVGHGYMEGWSDREALSIWRSPDGANDFDAMAANDRTGILVTANCLNGYFHDPDYPSLGEVALRTPHKGAVGFWGTAGYTISSAQFAMTRHFLDHLLRDGLDLGTASTLAKIELYGDGNPFWREELAAWVLLGDPATVMRH